MTAAATRPPRSSPLLKVRAGLALTGIGLLGLPLALASPPAAIAPACAATAPAAATWLADATPVQAARRSGDPAAIDAVVAALFAHTGADPHDAAAWHQLAEAALERILLRTRRRGLVIGQPTFATLPPEVAADVELGLGAVERARALGDDSGDLHRLEACLLGQRITGFVTALRWRPRIDEALAAAQARTPDDPQLHLVLGLRALLSPRGLGHDPARALAHFETAAGASADGEERAPLFAAMAAHLLQRREAALDWLERAIAANPGNPFARVVRRRLLGGEAEPFARDVSDDEEAAAP
ncbi:MAG: hypothetical protein KF830_18480 [Planctomycetes bacterium]|nr:hypothetical protein [Planctomycetota bacterium]